MVGVWKNRSLHAVFILTISASMDGLIPPVLPRMMETLQISPTTIGLVLSMYALPGIVLTPFAGLLADRLGRRKLAIFSLLCFSIAGISIAFTTNFPTILMLRAIQGVGRISLVFLALTLIGDLFKNSDRLHAMGANITVSYMGAILFSVFGGILADFSWRYPFFLHGLMLPATLFFALQLKETLTIKGDESTWTVKSVTKIVSDPRTLMVLMAGLILSYVFTGAILTCLPLVLKQNFEATSSTIGILLAVSSLASALTATRVGAFVKHSSRKFLLVGCFTAYGLVLAFIPYIQYLSFFILPLVLIGIIHGITIPITTELIASFPPTHLRGSVTSFYSTMVRTGQTLGPASLGLLLYFLGGEFTFIFAGIISLAFALSLASLLKIKGQVPT